MGETVQTAAIADGAVTTAKLAALAVTAAKLGADAVTEPKIKDGEIVNADIAAAAAIALSKMALDLTTHASRHESGGADEIDATGLTGAGTKEVFFPAIISYGNALKTATNISHINCMNDSGDFNQVYFRIPHDFVSITDAILIWGALGAFSGVDLDLYSVFGADGEDYHQHEASDTASTYTFTADKLEETDISSLLSGLAADDEGVFQVIAREALTAGVFVLGIKLRYA